MEDVNFMKKKTWQDQEVTGSRKLQYAEYVYAENNNIIDESFLIS